MKKIYAIILLVITSIALTLSACGNPYKNMKLELITGDKVEIYLTDNTEVETPEGELAPNTAQVKAKISGAGKKISKEISFVSADTDRLQVLSTEMSEDGEVTALLRAFRPGVVNVDVISKEGGKRETITALIYRNVTGISFDSTYTPAVVANGQPHKLDSTKVLFKPSDANVRDLEYSLVDTISGATITADGELTVTDSELDVVRVRVRPTVRESEDVFAEIDVKVLPMIDINNISFTGQFGVTSEPLENEIKWIKNSLENALYTVTFAYTDMKYSDMLRIRAVIDDANKIVEKESARTNNSVTLSAIDSGLVNVRFEVHYAGFESMIVASKQVAFNVVDAVTTIDVSSTSMTIFNAETTSSYRGEELKISLLPKTASSLQYRLEFSDAYQDNLIITDATGGAFALDANFNSDVKLYLRHDGSVPNARFSFDIVPVGDYLCEPVTISIECLTSVEIINTDVDSIMLAYNEEMDIGVVQELAYTILPEGALKETINVVSNNTNVVEVYFDDVDNKHMIVAKGIGFATISMNVNGRTLKNISVEVVAPFDTFGVDIDAPATNPNVSGKTMTNLYDSYDRYVGRTLSSAVIKVGANIKLNIFSYPTNSQIKTDDITYTIEAVNGNASYATIDSRTGILNCSSNIELFKIKIGVIGWVYDSSGDGGIVESEVVTKEVYFSAIMPIESISINTNYVQIYDKNTIGIDEISQAQTILRVNVAPLNATINSQDVVWSVTPPELSYMLTVQEDGSALITGSLDGGEDRSFTVRATLTEYDKVFSVTCTVKVVKAKTVEQILLEDYNEARGVYLKGSDVNTSFEGDTYQIKASPMPVDVKNSNFKYFAFDIEPKGETTDGWYFDESRYDRHDATRIVVSNSGLVSSIRGQSGYAVVWVVPADNIRSDPIVFDEIKLKRVILVNVADGSIENPYEINNYTDFVNIANAPDKAYRIAQTIDFANIANYAPIGTETKPFTGYLTGEYVLSNGQTIINSITNFKLNRTNVTDSAYLGLFGYVGSGAVIEKLNVTVMASALEVNTSSADSVQFGYIAGVNFGAIRDVTTRFNGDLSIKNLGVGRLEVGALVGQNNGTIENCRSITYSNFGLKLSEANALTYLGGIAGTNTMTISGKFTYVGDSTLESSTPFDYNVDFNDENVNSTIYIVADSLNVNIGGITGYNTGRVSGVQSEARLAGATNVGGITARNEGVIFACRFTGFINSNNQAGGIAGVNALSGKITFGIVEICDDEVHFRGYNDSDIVKFGGVVGENSANIAYSYVNSYSAQRTENNVNPDIILTQNLISFGAFVGENTGQITKSFANVQMNVLLNDKLFVGNNAGGSINLCYTLSYNGAFTATSQTLIGGNASDTANFITIPSMNFGLPMILINQLDFDENGEVLLTQSPNSLSVKVYGERNVSNYGKDSLTSRYYKVDDKKLVLLLNNSLVSSELNINTYDMRQIFEISTVPSSSRNKTVLVDVIEGGDVLSIEGTNIIALKEGYAKLRFRSGLDSAIQDEIEVYVALGITNLNIENINSRTESGVTYNELRLQIEKSFNFNIRNINAISTGDTTTNYSPLQSGGYLFAFDDADFVDFDKAQEITNKAYMVNYADSQIITALSAGITNVVVYPVIYASFFVDDEFVVEPVVLSDVKYEFSLYIYNGLTDVLLQSSSEEIMPNTTLNYNVSMKTDLSDSVLNSLRIYKGDYIDDDTIEQEYEVFDLSTSTLNMASNTFNKEISADSKFELSILNIDFDAVNAEKNIVFEITPSKEINGELAILEQEKYTIIISATLGSGQVITKQFKLTLKPQSLSSIIANHYNDGDDFDDKLTNAGEEVSTRIIPGQYGLLVVNLWPEYSSFDRLDITSSLTAGDVITFEQVYYNIDANNYDTKVENTQNITNGISVKRESTKRYDAENDSYVYAFDGRIFLRTLTGTNVPTGQVFTVTISAYNAGESTPYLTHSIELTSLQAPYLTFNFTSGRNYKGIANEYYASEQTNFNFTMVTDSVISETTGITSVVKDSLGNIMRDVTLVKSGDTTVQNSRQTINYVIPATSAFEKGQTYYVEMVVTRQISGITTKSKVVNVLHIVDFIVTNFSLYDEETNTILVSNNLLSRPLSTTGWLIGIRLETIASETNKATTVANMERVLNGKDKYQGRFYNPWKYLVLSGTNAGQYDSITSEDVSKNFVMSLTNEGYRLIGKTIANVDTLMADFSYYYNNAGQFCLVNDPSISIDGNPSTTFRLDFSLSSSQDHPLPVTTKEEFLAMEEGIDYILLNDIDLGENYEPMNTAISSLDGNGYVLTIQSMSIPRDATNSVNLGLFGRVDSSTLLKNITVKLGDNFSAINLESFTSINFGIIAGVNEGIITNADVDFSNSMGDRSVDLRIAVQSSSQEGETSAYIGALVGDNSNIITNSRVEHLVLESSGVIGGLVAINNGVIASSYVLDLSIQSFNGYVGGLVAVNNGQIGTSYVRGNYSKTDSRRLRAVDSVLNAVGQVGGFVYQNTGTISDCYANIKITSQSRSAGFVYENTRSGEIYNCLSLSDIIQNSIAHMPFVGTDSSDRFTNAGTLENCYYYQNEDDRFVAYDIDANENPAQKMTEEDLTLSSSLAGFAFSDNSAEFSGVWVHPSATNSYFNTSETFGVDTRVEGFSKTSFRIGIPELVAPNVIAKSVRKIDSVITNDLTGESIYNYIYVTQSNAVAGERAGYAYGTIHNQALIASVDDFVYQYEKYQNNNLIVNSTVNSRLINNIDFLEYGEKLNTPKVTLSAIIEGNGLNISNISVVSDVDEKYTEFGLFKRIQGNSDTVGIASIKNLTFSFNEVKSSSSNIVGSIAGTMHNANLIDVEVLGQRVAVKGANIVGGVVGLVTGNSRLYKISTNISANSGFRNSGNSTLKYVANDGTTLEVENAKNILYVDDSLFYTNVDETIADLAESTPLKNTVNYVSYAGAVAGVIETKHEESIMECYLTPNIYDITVYDDVKVIGGTAGGVIGMAGLYTFLSKVQFIINASSFISADDVAGGLIGELRGKLSQSSIIHETQDNINNLPFGGTHEEINMHLFSSNTTTKASGGIVGFNLGGTILDCISYAYVRNPYSTFAGGLVGVTISGDIKAVIATGSVLGRTSVGGLIGGVIATNNTGADNFYNYNLLPLYYNNSFNIENTLLFDLIINGDSTITYDQNSMVLSYVMAGNNWTANDQETLSNIQNWGGLIGYFDTKLSRTYITTTHPQDENSDVNLINFYVAGGNNTDLLTTRGNEDSGEISDWMHIAEPIPFSSLTAENKTKYFGSYYRFVWDLTGNSRYPTIKITAIPDTIEIASAYDLLQIIWNLSGNYLLVDDIDLSGIDSWLPLGTEVEPFSGTLRSSVKVDDGTIATRNTYYEIQNLKIVASNIQYVGLFGVTGFNYKTQEGATFENLVITVEELVGSDFQGVDSFVGALVADARGATINNVVTAPASKNAMIASSSNFTGGIVGRMSNLLSDVDVDEEDATQGKIVIKSSIKNSLSTLNIGVVNRKTNSNAGEVSQVGGVIGHLRSGVIENTSSNQTIALAQAVVDGLTGQTHYEFVEPDRDYHVDLYTQSLYIGGLIGSNSSQFLDAGGNSEGGQQETKISTSFSNSNIEIAKLNLIQVGTARIDTYLGGFAGVLDENIDVYSCFSTGKITTNGDNLNETPTNVAKMGGFVGKININFPESSEKVTEQCYSLVTLVDGSTYADIKGFGFIGYGDIDSTNDSNATSVAYNCSYEHYYALVVDYDKNFGVSSRKLKETFGDFREFTTTKEGIYYPVLTDGDFVLGINDRSNKYAVYGSAQGSKLNPILITSENSLMNVAQNANTRDEYLYFLVINDISQIDTHIIDAQGNVISNNSPMIDEFNGFLNGNGYSVGGFTIKETPKVFDEDYNVVEDDSGIENAGLIKVLKAGSYVSGLSLTDVYIDYQSTSETNNSTINVAGLVGTMERGSGVFASTVSGEIFVKGAQYEIVNDGSVVVTSRNQKLNMGGIVGYNNGGSIINSANYARIASFDYHDYKGTLGTSERALDEVNAGGIAGKVDNNSTLLNVFSISDMNFIKDNLTYATTINYGSLIGMAQNATIKNWYAKVNLIKKEYSNATPISDSVGRVVVTSGGISTVNIEAERVQTLSINSDLTHNYGYEFAPLLEDCVPISTVSMENTSGTSIEYFVPTNTETLMFLLKNNYNIALKKDIYVSNITTTPNYSGKINGQFHSIYGIDNVLIDNVGGVDGQTAVIENIALSGTEGTYTGDNSFAFTTLGSQTSISCVDLKTTKNTMNLSKNKNAGISLIDINAKDVDFSSQLISEEYWLNLSSKNDESGNRIRNFVENWNETDLRGVYLSKVVGIRTVIVKDEAGNPTSTQVEELRNRVNDEYQLAKYAKLTNEGDEFELDVTELNATSTFDLDGKIWPGLINFEDSLVSSSEVATEKPKIANLYVEGDRYLGFISNYVASEGRIFNIEFHNAKLVSYNKYEGTPTYDYYGVVAGSALTGEFEKITVSGVISIDAPQANYVGIMFGETRANLIDINLEGNAESNEVADSKVVGLDFVGGVAGSATLTGMTVKNIDNNYNISGRDFVGGYFGYATGGQSPAIYGYEEIVGEHREVIRHKNSGTIVGRNFVGGIVGYDDTVTLNCVMNEGNVTGSGYAIGGIAGYLSSQILSSINGVSTLSTVVSHISSEASSSASDSLATRITAEFAENVFKDINIGLSSNEVAEGYFVGGFVGYFKGSDIRSAVNTETETNPRQNINYATVRGVSFVGGIAGLNNQGNIYSDNIYLENIDSSVVGIKHHNSVEGKTFVGGIVGLNYSAEEGHGVIKDVVSTISYVEDNISGEYCVGGIAGANYGYIWSVATAGVIGGQTANLGGIAGFNSGEIRYATSAMIVTLTAKNTTMTSTNGITASTASKNNYYVGGVTGHNVGLVRNSSYLQSNGSSAPENAGTILFTLDSSISNTFNVSKVYLGGLVGVNEGEVVESYVDNLTNVNKAIYPGQTVNGSVYIGGLVAENKASASILNCYSLARIKSIAYSDLQGAFDEVELSSDNTIGGGLVHINHGSIEGCYARYSIANENNGTIADDCYVMNSVTYGDVTQLEVDSNYKTQFAKFLDKKFVITDVEISSLSFDEDSNANPFLKDKMFYSANSISIKLMSRDGAFADTDSLVNNESFKLEIPNDSFYDKYIKCRCKGGETSCECQALYGCCDAIKCSCSFDRGLNTNRSPECIMTHMDNWIKLFNLGSDFTNDMITFSNEMRADIFSNVIFNLAYTGVITPSNGTLVVETEVKNQPATTPSTGFLGSGTSGDPYRIYSVNDLDTLNTQLQFGNTYAGKWFKMMNDIDLSGVSGGYTIGTEEFAFQGYFDGNGQMIIGNHLKGTDNVGLFPVLTSSAQVQNINFLDCSSEGDNNVGILAGRNRGTIQNIEIKSSNSSSKSTVKGKENVGGIVGYNQVGGRIIKCTVGGDVTGETNVGGIAGFNDSGNITYCETVTRQYTDSDNYVDMTFEVVGGNFVGGIVGKFDGFGVVSQCTNEVTVRAMSGYAGGILGYSSGQSYVSDYFAQFDLSNRGNVFGEKAGQIAGALTSQAKNVIAYSATGDYLGEGSASSLLVNKHKVNSQTDSIVYQINALKNEYYPGFDFGRIWGMSPTQLNTDTDTYSNPYISKLKLNDNYPRIMGLKSSERYNGAGTFFADQYFVVDDIQDTTRPTMYIESQKQLDILLNYFLGEYSVAPPSDESYTTEYTKVVLNYQYNYVNAIYKLYKGALNKLDSSKVYNSVQNKNSWTALPPLMNRAIDFSGLTMNITTMTDYYDFDNPSSPSQSPSRGVTAFISSFVGYSTVGPSMDYIKGLNLKVANMRAGTFVAPILGYLGNGYVQNCNVEYTSLNPISYAGSYPDNCSAGLIVASFSSETGMRIEVLGCKVNSGFTTDLFQNYSSVNDKVE